MLSWNWDICVFVFNLLLCFYYSLLIQTRDQAQCGGHEYIIIIMWRYLLLIPEFCDSSSHIKPADWSSDIKN